jgi:hypothetical protein
MVDKVMGLITDPKRMATYSYPERIAEVVYDEAATDGKEQLRYLAGDNAKRSLRVCHWRRGFPQGNCRERKVFMRQRGVEYRSIAAMLSHYCF